MDDMDDMDDILEDIEESGRDTDTIVGHLTAGEIVIPADMAKNPEVQKVLKSLFENGQVSMDEFTVGHPSNKINPKTGYPEFFSFKSIFKPITSIISSVAKAVGLAPKAPDMGPAIAAQQAAAKKAEEAAAQAKAPQADESVLSAMQKDQLRRRRGRAANILAQDDEPISVGARRLLGY